MAWSKGEPWRVVRSLNRLNAQVRAAYPRAVPPATPVSSWGAVADSAHSSTSDHFPHYYRALGGTAVVCARDFPHAPALGLDAHALAERLRQSRDSRIGYLISNRRITGPGHGWRWDRYYGDDPHDTHIHVSTVHTAAADDDRDWQIGDDMPITDADARKIAAAVHQQKLGKSDVTIGVALQQTHSRVGALAEAAGVDQVDEQQIVSGVLSGLAGVDLDDAVTALKAAFGDRAAELGARLAS